MTETDDLLRSIPDKYDVPTLQSVTPFTPRTFLLIDGECRLCTTVAALGQRLGVGCGVETLQSVDLAAWGIDASRMQNEVALRSDDGVTRYGHEAVSGALMTGPWFLRLVGGALLWRQVAPLARRGYRWVARRRRRGATEVATTR